MSTGRVFTVSKETQARERLSELRREMNDVQVPVAAEPAPTKPDTTEQATAQDTQTLESLVEQELKKQLRTLKDRDLGLAIMNAIKFLAVRSRIPVQFGSELDEPSSGG